MIHFDNNKFIAEEYEIKNECTSKDVKKCKGELIKLLREKLDISKQYNIYSINNIYEAYEIIIHSMILAYKKITKTPVIVANKMEDPNLLKILQKYTLSKDIIVNYVRADIYGCIDLKELEVVIKSSTPCLVVCSFVNFFTGSLNNLKKIGEISHKYKAPVFCDCSYIFGKDAIHPTKNNIDIFTISMDIEGLSFVIIHNDLWKGYELSKYNIKFDNNVEERNIQPVKIYKYGTALLKKVYKNRKKTNERLYHLKKYLVEQTNSIYFDDYLSSMVPTKATTTKATTTKAKKKNDIIVLSHKVDKTITSPHIISLFVKSPRKTNITFCGVEPSVYTNIGIAKKYINQVITIGLPDHTTKKDIDMLISFL